MRRAILSVAVWVLAPAPVHSFCQAQPVPPPPVAFPAPPGPGGPRLPPPLPGFWVTFPNVPPLSRTDQARVAECIRQLEAADYRVREKAGQTLAAIGERALPAMRAALKTVDDPEANRRLQIIVRKIDTDRLAGPRRVTLNVANAPVKVTLHELAKQSGYPIQIQNVGDEKLRFSFQFAGTPFWEALDQVCNTTGLVVNQNDEAGTLVVSFGDTFSPHVAFAGPFRFTAQNIASTKQLQLGALNRQQPPARQPEAFNLNVMIQAEPKAPIIRVGQVALTKATDDQGRMMLADETPTDVQNRELQEQLNLQQNNGRSFAQYFNLTLVRGDRAAAAIKELRGKVRIGIHAENRPEITIDNVLDVKKKQFTGRTIQLEVVSAVRQMGVVTIDLVARSTQPDDQNMQWTNGLPQRFELTDEKGTRFEMGDVNMNNDPTGVTIKLTFAAADGKKTGKPVRLQLVEWITVTKEFEFHFKDIPLP